MLFEIKHRITGNILFSLETTSLKLCLQAAVSSDAYLGGADLRGADLRGAYLRGADLGDADLRGAYLGDADLRGAYLRGAYLRGAYLRGAYLGGAYLRGADLGGADLRGADLGDADLRGAYLGDAYLRGAYLGGAYLRGADLRGAYLDRVKEPTINDHYFVSEVLFRQAKTEAQKDFAARIRIERQTSWPTLATLAKSKGINEWAKEILCKWDAFKEKIEEHEHD